jgi:holin-like protein
MVSRRTTVLARRFFRRSAILQIGLVAAFWFAGVALGRGTGLPLPGGVIGLFLALAVLHARGLPVMTMKRGADWLLAEMLLFFVPAVLAILDHRELFGLMGVKIVSVIVVSTITVMVVTALTVDVCYRWKERHAGAGLVD